MNPMQWMAQQPLRGRMKRGRLRARETAIDLLRSNGRMTTDALATELGCTRRNAQLILDDLLKIGRACRFPLPVRAPVKYEWMLTEADQ